MTAQSTMIHGHQILVLMTLLTGAACAQIPGLDQALDPNVTVGTVVHVIGPPNSARDSDHAFNSIDSVRAMMESHKGPGSVYDTIRNNYPTEAHPGISISQIETLVRQQYDNLVSSRMNTPAVTSIGVQHMTLNYPVGYFNNSQVVSVPTRRLTLNAPTRTLVAYFANYDKVDDFGGNVVWQVNGHFLPNPTRQALGLENKGGLSGAALGKIAMQGYPLIAYDDHNVGESSNAPDSLPRTLENLQMMDRTLMTHFQGVDTVGLSGGTERLYHFMNFFESNIESVYYSGFAVPQWTRLTMPPFGSDGDTHDPTFLQNFQFADLALVGISRGVETAFAHQPFEGGGSKYGYFEEMAPTMMQYTNQFETRGSDLNGNGLSDTSRQLAHEYDLVDLFAWLDGTTPPPPGAGPPAVLHLDAAFPGNHPTVGWEDLTGNNSPFSLVNNTSYDSGEQAYLLPQSTDFLQSMGADESNFDFGWNQPYTMVAYIKPNGAGQHGNGLIQKNHGENNRGFAMQPSFPGSQKVSVNSILAESNGARTFSRDQEFGVVNGDPNDQYHLIITTHDGSAHNSGLNMYYNGVLATHEDYGGEPSNAQNQDITNDEPLRIGWDPFSGPPSKVAGFAGHVAIIEIWPTDQPMGMNGQEYATFRWNDGNVQRGLLTSEEATAFQWNQDSLGDWANSSHWTPVNGNVGPVGIANHPNHTVIFPNNAAISGPTNVSTNATISVNRIEFANSTHRYVVSGIGSLNLYATTDPNSPVNPSIHVAGTHEFQVIVNLAADTGVEVGAGSTLSFNHAFHLNGRSLTKTGTGNLEINNRLTTAGGGVTIQQGTVSGIGSLGGDVSNIGGTMSPGRRTLSENIVVPEP